jgi:tetratricopeptide (TPR) repeat protein
MMQNQIIDASPSFDADRLVNPAERYSWILSLIKKSVQAGYLDGDWQSVMEITNSLTKLGELDDQSRLLRAKAMIELGRFDEATTELIALAAKDPWCATTQNLLGEARLYTKKYKDAIRSYANAISIKAMTSILPCETISYLGRAMAFTLLGRHQAAASDMNTYAMLSRLQKARLHFWSGRHTQCSLYLDTLPTRLRNLPAAQYLRIRNIMAVGDYDKALEEFPKAVASSHVSLPLLYCRAICNFKTGNLEACVSDLNKIIGLANRVVLLEVNPISREIELVDLGLLLNMRADCYKQLKNYSAAIEDYERVIYYNPSPETYLSRAQVLYRLGLVVRALADLEKASDKLGSDPELLSLKILCLNRLDRKHEAAKVARIMLVTNPQNEIARKTLQMLEQSMPFTPPVVQSQWIAQ